MFILYSISNSLEFWSVNHTSIYENFELNVFENIQLFGEISNNWPNDLLVKNVYKTQIVLIIVVKNITVY